MNTPFLGSKISLISRSEIRYEGILYTIDTKESTIALSKVRSYGTEDRPTDKPIAPRDEVYEYIIFRASDIKDLIVDDPPATGHAPGLADPAIIQAHSISAGGGGSGTGTGGGGGTGTSAGSGGGGFTGSNSNVQSSTGNVTPSAPSAIGQRPANNAQAAFPNSMTTTQSGVTGGPPSGPAFGSSGASTPTPTQGNTIRRSPIPDGAHIPGGDRAVGSNRGDGYMNNNRWQNRGNNRMQPQNRRPGQGQGPMHQHHPGHMHQGSMHQGHMNHQGPMYQRQMAPMNYRGGRQGQYPGPPRGRGPMINRAPPQPRAQYNNNNNNRGMPHRTKPEGIKIDGDYDFEKANLEFQELESKLSKIKVEDGLENEAENKVKEIEEEKAIEDKQQQHQQVDNDKNEDDDNEFYDKTKSFFDKISCEALERSKGKVNRIDWKQERKMNVETFGTVPNHFRRGGYRGRGYNGYRQNRNYYNQRGRMGPNLAGGDTRKTA